MFLAITAIILFVSFIILFIWATILLVRRLYNATWESNRAHVALYSCYDWSEAYTKKKEKDKKKEIETQ